MFDPSASNALRVSLAPKVEWLMSDGAQIDTSLAENGKVVVAKVSGSCRAILQGERTALNVISRCSGVATATAEAVQKAASNGWKGYVAGTRKTTPGDKWLQAFFKGKSQPHRLVQILQPTKSCVVP